MFCPKCAAQNVDGASFCRVCGANVSLVPQALAGRLPEAQAESTGIDCWPKGKRRRRGKEVPSLEKGIVSLFMGLGFIAAALAVMFRFPEGFTWGWALFFPAFTMLGKGVAAIVAASKTRSNPPNAFDRPSVAPALHNGADPRLTMETPRRNTGELMPVPPSVTEGTTRHLGMEAPTRHLDS